MNWLLVVLQLWILCGCTVVAASLLGMNVLRVARFTPVLAVVFLFVRVLV